MAAAKKKGTAIVNYNEKMAQYAKQFAEAEKNVGGGSFFSMKSGVLSYQDNPLPGNEMAVIIVDYVLENVFYEGDYDPDVQASPSCFAFGRDDDSMAPHDSVLEAGTQQNDVCHGCPMNEFGSADKGKGKACKNTRRIAMIPAGKFLKDGSLDMIEDTDHYLSAEVGYMKLPVTSVKGFSSFVKQVATNLKRPPFGVVTKVKVVPDANSQFKVLFEALVEVPDELMEAIFKRNEEVEATISFPYQPQSVDEAPKKKGVKSKAPAKKRKF